MTPVKRILEESDGVKKVTFEPETETFLLEVTANFQLEEASKRILLRGKKQNQGPGREGRPDWVMKVVEVGNLKSAEDTK